MDSWTYIYFASRLTGKAYAFKLDSIPVPAKRYWLPVGCKGGLFATSEGQVLDKLFHAVCRRQTEFHHNNGQEFEGRVTKWAGLVESRKRPEDRQNHEKQGGADSGYAL